MQFHLCVDATSQFVENPVEAESVGETILSILDFTIFLHEEGLCSKQEEQEQQQGETTDWQTGTGLGEGSGVNDKSDEIEDAGQFDDTEQPSGDQGDKEDCDEPDLDKGVDANADQGMNESDVEEHNMPQKDEEDDDDREMGDVDMNDGGKVDESGAPDNEDDEEVEESGDNVELKNEAEANEGEDDTRAQEKEAKDAAGDGNHEEGEEEGEGEEDREDKIEAFVDQGREDPEEHNGDEMGDDEDIEEGLEQEGEEGEAEEEMEEDGPENPEQEAEILETGKPEDEQQESEETEETINQQGIDSTAGGAHEDDHKPDESLAAKSGQEEQRDGADGGQDSSESAQAMADRGGMDRSQKNQQGAAKNQVKPAPCPLEPNSKEALDEWLKEISEIIEKNANEQKTSGGDSGELDQESEQATVAEAQRAGATNQTPQKEDEEMKYADEKTSPSESKDAEEGVDRDQVMQDVSEEPVGAPEQQSMEETTEEVAEQKVHKQTSGPSLDETEEKRKDGELDASPGAPVQNPESNLEVTDLNLQDTEVKVNRLCNELTEKLLAVLEPTKRGRLEGFFRAGKRISMRRVLSWIASDYRKDKFWLRRTRPSHRDYRVMICMDNTMSMRNNGVGEMALVCVSALAQSLQLLEVGKVGVLSFGTDVREICPLDDAKSGTSCSSVEDLARHLRFNEESSSSFSDAFPSVIHKCAEVFRSGEEAAGSLALVITDGRFDKDRCRPFVQELIADGHIPVLIVMDANKEESILSVTSVHFEEDTTGPVKKRKVVRKPFLSQSDCPFPFYAVIQDPSQLPTTLADILRQWIEVFAK
jgi:midasin